MRRFALLLALLPAIARAEPPALPHFPYEVIEVPGTEAVAAWERLRAEGNGTPIIVGSAEDLLRLFELAIPTWVEKPGPAPEDVLKLAATLDHPRSLFDLRQIELRQAIEYLQPERDDLEAQLNEASQNGDEATANVLRDVLESLDAPPGPPEIGDWPDAPVAHANALLSLDDWETGRPFDKVYLVLLPTDDPAETPAYLRLGGWNAHPPAAYHVAAFRAWADRYGAVPMLINADVIEFRVARPPQDRDAAIALALEQYEYCPDNVDQGTGSVAAFAATLLGNSYWYFWWD